MKALKLFRYSGNKGWALPLLRPLPQHSRIVEPYLGSGSFSLNQPAPALGLDTNPDVCAIWEYCKAATPDHLLAMKAWVASLPDKTDIRQFNMHPGMQAYVKVNCCSVMVGQLSSWKTYKKHQLPVENTIEALSRLPKISVVKAAAECYQYQEGDLVFLDPPYVETAGNYKTDGRDFTADYSPEETLRLIARCPGPIIFTYGANAPRVFPGLPWEVLKVKKVPNIRRGGTVDRVEHICYLNWRV